LGSVWHRPQHLLVRAATHRYDNMDQIVGQALATFWRIDAQLGHPASGPLRPTAPAFDAHLSPQA
jgi:UDP-galactopyranose mutase